MSLLIVCSTSLNAETAIKKPLFQSSYEDLRAARSSVEKARARYDRSSKAFSKAVAVHRECNGQLQQLREAFLEVGWVGECVCIYRWKGWKGGYMGINSEHIIRQTVRQ